MVLHTGVMRCEPASVRAAATPNSPSARVPLSAACWRRIAPSSCPRAEESRLALRENARLALRESHGARRHSAQACNGTRERASGFPEAGAGSGSLSGRQGHRMHHGIHMASALNSSSGFPTTRPMIRTANRSFKDGGCLGNASREGGSVDRGRCGRGTRAPRASDGGPGGLAAALPSPPAGFILNEEGEVVLMAPEAKRLLVLEDESGRRLECVIRRTFFSSTDLQFFLLYPLDVPVIIYKVSEETGGLIETEEREVQDAFPQAAHALARRNFHLVLSAFVLTVRGAVCFDQEDVTTINVEYGLGIGSDLAEGVEIAAFTHKGTKFVVYTPFDPLLFVAYRDPDTGAVMVAEDEEDLNDPRVEEAIEEEQEYQRMVNEEEEMSQLAKAGQAKANSA